MSFLPPVAFALLLAHNAPAGIAGSSLRESLLAPFTVPDIAVLALIIGVLLIYLEFNVPGKVLPGALGTLLVTLALFGLLKAHLHYASALLLLIGVVLLLVEARFRLYGLFAIAGAAAFIFGLANLVDGSTTGQHVHPATAIILGTIFSIATLALGSIAIRARRNKATPGPWQ